MYMVLIALLVAVVSYVVRRCCDFSAATTIIVPTQLDCCKYEFVTLFYTALYWCFEAQEIVKFFVSFRFL